MVYEPVATAVSALRPWGAVPKSACAALGLLLLLSACGPTQPSRSLVPVGQQFQADALSLSATLNSLEWDLHAALQRKDEDAARTAAVDAVKRIERFLGSATHAETPACLDDFRVDVGQLMATEQERWRNWSEGRDFPNRDEISLFFAFYGAEKPWVLVLRDALAACQHSA